MKAVMNTPFAEEAARSFITDELHDSMHLLDYINIVFSSLTEELSDDEVKSIRETDLPQYKDMTDEEIRESFGDDVDEEIACQVWTGALLLDAVMNGHDYSADCIGYSDEYIRIIEMIKAEMEKKKLFSRKPLYNIPQILQNGIDSLDYVLGINNESELAEKMKNNGDYEKWEKEIIDLQNRLSSHI